MRWGRLFSRLRCLFVASGDFCFSGVLFLAGTSSWACLSATSNLNEFLTKFSKHVEVAKLVDIAVPELAVTSLPRLLACRPWQAASGSSGNCITVTAGNHHPHIGEQGRVLVLRQQFWSTLQFFYEKKKELTA